MLWQYSLPFYHPLSEHMFTQSAPKNYNIMFKIELNIIRYFKIIMNKRINKCMEAHFAQFKHEILHTLQTTNNIQSLNSFIENYKIPYIEENDYQKRHRTKT